MSTNSTPLLLLLNELLSHNDDEAGRQQQREAIRNSLYELNELVGGSLTGISPLVGSQTMVHNIDSVNLVHILNTLLSVHPELARIPSPHDGSLPLHFAASLGDVNAAAVLVRYHPAAASKPNKKGKLPLHYAAREGRVEMVRYFMRHFPETVSISTKKDKLPLHFAVAEGHVAVVQSLLQAYPKSASLPSAKGKVPLHFASRWGYLSIAMELFHMFPDGIRTLDWEGSLPLHEATREGQYPMARFLVERFPPALATANLRGDIPLFTAVRSGNIDLVAFLVQAWPEGGRHVLQNITESDELTDWDNGALELLLRGAVDNFDGCEVLHGRDHPPLRLISDLKPVVVGQPLEDWALDQFHPAPGDFSTDHVKSNARRIATTVHHQVPPIHEFATCAATASACSSKVRSGFRSKSRCKSPTFQEDSNSEVSPKRFKSSIEELQNDDDCETGSSSDQAKPTPFLPLHAALKSDAAAPVVSYILDTQESKEYSSTEPDIQRTDDHGCSALHHAVQWAKGDAKRSALVVTRIVKPYPQAASHIDGDGTLPLIKAIEVNVHPKLISAVLMAYPPGALGTNRDGVCPVELACIQACELSTIYILLRVDPSFVKKAVTRDKGSASR